MTRSASKPTAKPGTSALTGAMAAGHPAARMWLDIMSESTRFVSERLQNDLETQQALLRCKNPAELVRLQSEFFRKAVEQYTSEAHRLFEIMTGAATEAAKGVRSPYSRGYDDVPL